MEPIDIKVNGAPQIIAQLFEQAREQRVSQRALAIASGLPAETLTRLKGRSNVELRTVERLARALGYELTLRPIEHAPADVFLESVKQGQYATLFGD